MPLNLWSDFEIEESVRAYLWMLNKEKNNESYNKSNLYRNLASTSLNNRSVHSIEWRFRNISYVLDQNNHEWIPGLSPASGVGNH